MPKYYLQTGDFKNIVDAKDSVSAVKKSILRIIKENQIIGPLMSVSEMGFSLENAMLTPTIPVMRVLGVDLPDDEVLEEILFSCCNVTREQMGPIYLKWLLTGEFEENV